MGGAHHLHISHNITVTLKACSSPGQLELGLTLSFYQTGLKELVARVIENEVDGGGLWQAKLESAKADE